MLHARAASNSCRLSRFPRWLSNLLLLVMATTAAWGSLAVDVVRSTDRSSSATTIATPAFSTVSGNELLLAFIATDGRSAGMTVTGVAGAGLTWALVRRTNAQLGTSEIWRAFALSVLTNVTVTASLSQSVGASITVVTFTGADNTGVNGAGAVGNSAGTNASAGAPSASMGTSRNGSWVFGVGNDWDRAVNRTVGSSQSVLHQYLATVGDTYWVQQQISPTVLSGTQVFINDTAPTNDRYNLSIVEVLPAATSGGSTFNVSGTVSTAASGAGATVTLTQGATTIASSTADASGNYNFAGLSNGSYTVTPSKTGFNFTPPFQSVTVNGANQTANFTAAPQTWTVSGTVTPAANGAGSTLSLIQGSSTIGTAIADASGSYTFPGVSNGAYTVTPAKSAFSFTPLSQSINVSGANVTSVNFSAAAQTWTIQGTISGGAGASVTLSRGSTIVANTNADSSGNYTLNGVANGMYTVTPGNAGYIFTPASQIVAVNGAAVTGINFTAAPTWTIQGNISPVSAAAGAIVTLTQSAATVATANTDSGGNFGFDAVNGVYTATPTRSGYSFTPPSQTVTVSGAPVNGISFIASPLPTYTISGNIANGNGASVTLSGVATASTTADASGNFSFGGLSNGSYTVAASKAGFTISPASQQVTVSSIDVPGVNFAALSGLALDAVAFGDSTSASSAATTSAFSTAGANELLLAFIASDASSSGMSVTGVSGGSLNWVLVRRTNTQLGTAEVWRAFAPSRLSNVAVTATLAQTVVASITVAALTGAETSGVSGSGAIGATASGSAASGAPSASLVATRNGSWVFGVGNDFDRATARTVGANQTMVHQSLSSTGDTYWVQRQNNITPLSGTSVTINDTAPTGDRYNLTIVEVLPPGGAYSISGSVSSLGSGAAIALSGAATATTIADGFGNYAFTGLNNGSYIVTPSKTSVSFSPPSQTAAVNGASVAGLNFMASLQTWTLSGNLSPASNGAGATLTLGGASSNTATADTLGNYSFSALTNGTYSVTPSKSGYTFSPTVQSATINGGNAGSINFSVSVAPPPAITVSISPTSSLLSTGGTQQFTATVTGTSNTAVTWTATSGTISSSGLYTAPSAAGTYTVRATSMADTSKFASAAVTVSLPGTSTVLLGDQNVESQADSSLPLGIAEAFQTTAISSGNVQSLALFLDSTSTVSQVVAGLYADAAGHPGSLLSQGISPQLLAGAWNTISLPTTSVTVGRAYWIAVLGTTSGTMVVREGAGASCSSETSSQSALTSLPSTWATGGAGSTCPLSAFGDSAKVVFFDTFPGNTLSPNWTVISRHGEYAQAETECNIPEQVTVANGLTITTAAQSTICGDFHPDGTIWHTPAAWPYKTGDVQWKNLNFTYGTVEIRAAFPVRGTSLWPATWLLGSNCQSTNPLTGETGVGTCPNIGQSGYTEIDMTECFSSAWCQFHIANPNFGIGGGCDATYNNVDTNFHTFKTVWSSSGITQYMDGAVVSNCNQKMSNPMFLIIQTQTGGNGGTPNNSILPASLVVNYVKVTQP